jgi:hypothetical protein
MSITETVPVDEDAVSLKTKQILAIIYEYRLTKLADSHDLWTIGTPKFLAVIERYVRANTMLRMCLPAFPWKSANKIQKALGVLPDKAEEVALTRLDEMCARISHIYKPGAKLLIISDGLVYNGKRLHSHLKTSSLIPNQISSQSQIVMSGRTGKPFAPSAQSYPPISNFLASKISLKSTCPRS